MIGRFGGVAFDDGSWNQNEYFKCNHTVMLLMAWNELKGVENKSIGAQLGQRKAIRSRLEELSSTINPLYILALLNSAQVDAILGGVSSSAIKGEAQPDDLRQISIPIPDDPAVVAAIANLAQRASSTQKMLLPLRKAGWKIDDSTAQAPANIPANIPTLALDRARVKWGLHVSLPAAKVHKLVRSGHRLFSGKQEVAQIAGSEPEMAMEWLRRQFLTFPEGTTLGEIEHAKPQIPDKPEYAEKALCLLIQEEQRVAGLLADIKQTRHEISDQLEALFERINHPPIKSGKLAA